MKITDDVRRVITQIVEASCNAFARSMANRCRQMMADEQTQVDWSTGSDLSTGRAVGYVAGRNDVLRELAKYFDARIERSLVESVARDATALVEVVPDDDDTRRHREAMQRRGRHG